MNVSIGVARRMIKVVESYPRLLTNIICKSFDDWLLTWILLHCKGTPILADRSTNRLPQRGRRGNVRSTVSVLDFLLLLETNNDLDTTSNRVPAAPAFCGHPKLSPPTIKQLAKNYNPSFCSVWLFTCSSEYSTWSTWAIYYKLQPPLSYNTKSKYRRWLHTTNIRLQIIKD
jgi:hypothetical protein